MWVLKGSLFGVLPFTVFTIFFFIRRFSIRRNAAISLGTLQYLTIHNPWFWATLVLLVCAGCACARWFADAS
jgi:hypothetical protein